MATAADDVVVKLSMELANFNKGAQQGAASMQRLENGLNKSVARMKAALAALGVAVIARQFVQLADASANLNARIRLVAGSTANAAKVQKELLDVANRTRVGFESVVTLYTRLGRSADALGISQSRLLKFTETFSQALKISGASTAEASSTVIQLSQALAAGELRGAELNSVLEQGGRAATALAEGLGVPVGALKKMAEAGELTAARVIAAIESQSKKIQSEFDQMPTTVGDALTVVQNRLLNFVGKIDQTSGASKGLVDAINNLGKVLDDPDFAEGIGTALEGLVRLMTVLGQTAAWVGRQMDYIIKAQSMLGFKMRGGVPSTSPGGRIQRPEGGIGTMPWGGDTGAGWSPGGGPIGGGGGGSSGGGSSGGRNAAAEAIKREQDAIKKLIEDLQFEKTLVGQSAEQQAVMNNLRGLGASATEEQRVTVEAYTRALVQAEEQQRLMEETAGALGQAMAEAMKRLEEEAQELAEEWESIGDTIEDSVVDAFLDIAGGAKTAQEAVADLIADIGRLIAKALILKAIEGVTDAIFGTPSGGGKALGGLVNPGNAYTVGESGPELFVPNVGGSIIPNGRGGGSNVISINSVVNVPGGTSKTELQQMLNQRDRELVPTIINAVDDKIRRSSKYGTRR